MKKNIFIIALLLLFAANKMNAQRSVCYSNDFEDTSFAGLYNFRTDSDVAFTCNSVTDNIPQINPTFATYDNFNDPFTLVTSGNEPSLNSSGVNLQRVFQGNYSLKINSSGSPLKEISTIRRDIYTDNGIINFHYMIVAQSPDGLAPENEPIFIVRILTDDIPGIVIDQICLQINSSTPGFVSTPDNQFLYKDWSCENFILDESYINEDLIMEFVVVDDNKGAGMTTAYIDDICNVLCCENCINDLGDVINGVDHKEAEVCINADNSISNDSEAIYHAGYEVVLLPDFVASSGSSDRFYIESCSGEFAARGMSQQEESPIRNSMNNVYVYPNPANDRLNIDFGDLLLTTIEIFTLDGKNILHYRGEVYNSYSLDISGVNTGVYILKAEFNNGEIKTFKIVKN